MFKIATTETYEPAYCIKDWIKRSDEFDFVLFITKNLTPEIIDIFTNPQSKWSYINKPGIIHITCTGWGGTIIEPRVASLDTTKHRIMKLLSAGYPIERLVMRCDPIILTRDGLDKFKQVCEVAEELKINRIRCSIMQLYKHVLERFNKNSEFEKEINTLYNGKFIPDAIQNSQLYKIIKDIKNQFPNICFESCATNLLTQLCDFESCGCVSEKDLIINKIDANSLNLPKSTQRQNCMCLMKHQLIPGGYNKGRCPNECIYCYLKDKKEDKLKSGQLF